MKNEMKHEAENSMLKIMLQVTMTVVLTGVVCIILLFLTGLIPQHAIQKTCEKSAAYFYEEELFPDLIKGQFNTRQDNYADSILVNIMYHIDRENLPVSLLKASYYNPEMENVNVSFYDAVQEEKEPNVDYFRYWHGSMVLLRPLFLIMGIEGARLTLGILLLGLTILTAAVLFRKKETILAIAYLLGNVAVQTWMCAFCIEYITTFLVMNVGAVCMAGIYERDRNVPEQMDSHILQLMAAIGVVTCFLDFLTTETLTVTIPLLILSVFRYRDNRLQDLSKEIKRLATAGITWGVSYGAMFLLKWGISAIVLGRQAFSQALVSAGERISGTVNLGNTNLDPEADGLQRLSGALWHNQGSLFPFREEMGMGAAVVWFFGCIFLCAAVIYLFRDKRFSWKMIALCLILSMVPYLRYAALGNHAYLHYFFTYRAQLVTVTALLFCTWEFGIGCLGKRRKR